jgi:hypothetical protein
VLSRIRFKNNIEAEGGVELGYGSKIIEAEGGVELIFDSW